jgi:hypothetical protein
VPEDEKMLRVMILCPETNHPISANMKMEPETYRILKFEAYVDCPHCKQEHQFTEKDTYLLGDQAGH